MLKFAVTNPSNEVVSIHHHYAAAINASFVLNEICKHSVISNHSVQPIMTHDEWMKVSKDYRGFLLGRPATMYLINGGETVYGWVYLIDSWDDYQMYSGRYSELIVKEGIES